MVTLHKKLVCQSIWIKIVQTHYKMSEELLWLLENGWQAKEGCSNLWGVWCKNIYNNALLNSSKGFMSNFENMPNTRLSSNVDHTKVLCTSVEHDRLENHDDVYIPQPHRWPNKGKEGESRHRCWKEGERELNLAKPNSGRKGLWNKAIYPHKKLTIVE